jgi:multisubunit Na+/H+ antiporter MnhG subunit
MLKEEFKEIKERKKDLIKFGLSVGSVLLIVGFVLYYFEKSSSFYFIIIGGALLLLATIYPKVLKPLNKIWMGLAIILGFVMSRIILTVLFYLVLTPIGLLAKIFGKKFMDLKYDESAETYWEERKTNEKNHLDYERQF